MQKRGLIVQKYLAFQRQVVWWHHLSLADEVSDLGVYLRQLPSLESFYFLLNEVCVAVLFLGVSDLMVVVLLLLLINHLIIRR